MLFKNPIIPGYNPDPSICRVGEDFYLVNSTFEFFPGVPLYHSRNLINWELTGYCLTRREQLELEGCRNSGGIYAPTIRYHEGVFYMITTNVTHKGNFIVHTKDIQGEWSDPVWVDPSGIDPSLFWDDDGTCYYCSSGSLNGVRGIIGYVIDPMTGEILSEKRVLSRGCGGQCPEGPHLYKKDGYYYLMIAEGGTEYGHRETIQRSQNIWGPYEACPHNPIISHREYKKSEIQATGHADLVEDKNGNWWMVFLGFRRFSHALLHNLGRETFLAPVTWENGWPVIGYNGNGTIELYMDVPVPNPDTVMPQDHSVCIDFHKQELDKRLFYTRNPEKKNYVHDAGNGRLTLIGTEKTLNDPGTSPTVLSFKQPEFTTTLLAKLSLKETTAKRAGIAAYYNNDYHYDIYVGNDENGKYIGFYKHIHDMGVELTRVPIAQEAAGNAGQADNGTAVHDCDTVVLRIDTDREKYTFSYAFTNAEEAESCLQQNGGKEQEACSLGFCEIGSGLNAGLSTEGTRTMTFTGTLFSLFSEQGTGVFLDKVTLQINPDVDYVL